MFVDFLFYYQAFKIEEKKMCAHQKFEEITTKYWQLLKDSFDDSTTKTNIPKSYYIEVSDQTNAHSILSYS